MNILYDLNYLNKVQPNDNKCYVLYNQRDEMSGCEGIQSSPLECEVFCEGLSFIYTKGRFCMLL